MDNKLITSRFKSIIPEDVKKIMQIISGYGFYCFIVGGAIRNFLINEPIKDWDICTDATLEDLNTMFHDFNTKIVNKELGVMIVSLNNINYEITMLRKEEIRLKDSQKKNDHYRTKHTEIELLSNITHIDELLYDSERRDFTCNSIYYDNQYGILYFNNNLNDVLNKEIFFNGNPKDRIIEDPLRILRAIRFAAVYDFKINANCWNIFYSNKYLIDSIAKERIRDEFNKILNGRYFYKVAENILSFSIFDKMFGYNISDSFNFYQQHKYHKKTVFEHTINSLKLLSHINDLNLKLSLFFHDIGKKECAEIDENGCEHYYGHQDISANIALNIMNNLKYSKADQSIVNKLINKHSLDVAKLSNKKCKQLINSLGINQINKLILFMFCDRLSHQKDNLIDDIFEITQFRERMNNIINRKEPISILDLNINGYDLMKLSINGKDIGTTMEFLLGQVLERPSLNNKDELIKLSIEFNKKNKQ